MILDTLQLPVGRRSRGHLVSALAFDVVADTVVHVWNREPRHLDAETPTLAVAGHGADRFVRDVYAEASKAAPYVSATTPVLARHTRYYRQQVDELRRVGLGGSA